MHDLFLGPCTYNHLKVRVHWKEIRVIERITPQTISANLRDVHHEKVKTE